MAELPRLRVGLTLDSQTFIRETNKVIDSVNKMSRQIAQQNTIAARSFSTLTTATNLLKTSLVSLVGGLSLGALTRFGREALDAAGNLGELATRAGVSVRQLQQLQVAGLQVGISQEELVRSLGQFGIRVGEAAKGTGTLKDTLRQYGISVKNADGQVRSSVDILFDLADAVKNARSEQERLAIVSDAFGARIGAKFLPALLRGADGLRELMSIAERAGLVLGDEFVRQADRAADALSTIQFAVGKGFQIGFVKAFAGSVSDSADALVQAREAGEQFGAVVGEVFSALATAAAAVTPLLAEVRREFELIADGADIVKNILANLGFRELSLEDTNRQLGEINDRFAELAVQRETLARAAQEAGLAPENTEAIRQLNLEEDALRRRRDALLAQQSAAQAATDANKPLAVSIHGTVPPTNEATEATIDLLNVFKESIDLMDEVRKAHAKAREEQERWDASQIERENEALAGIAEQFIKRANEQRAATAAASGRLTASLQDQLGLQKLLLRGVSTESEEYRIHVALMEAKKQAGGEITAEQEKMIRLLEQQATAIDKQSESAEEVQRAFESAANGIQQSFADTFTTIFEGGVTSFSDLAGEIKHIFAQLAGQIAALMIIRPVLAGGALGAAGAAPSLAQSLGFGAFGGARTPTTFGTPFVPGGIVPVTPGVAAPGFLGAPSGATLGGLILSGGLGALGGSLIGGAFGGQGRIGGGVGGGLGAAVGTAFGGPIGGLAGGLAGSLAGGFLGSLFGGGGGQTNRARITGGLGLAGAGGTGAAAGFVRDIDAQLIKMLDVAQQAVADRALKLSAGVRVEYSKELSENDKRNLAFSRLVPATKALGLNAAAVIGPAKTAEEAFQRLAEALDVRQQVRDLASGFGDFASRARDVKRQFDDLLASAKEFRLSPSEREKAGLQARQAGFDLIRDQIQSLTGLAPSAAQQWKELSAQFRDVRSAAKLFGFSLTEVNRAQVAANAALRVQLAQQREQFKAQLGLNSFQDQWEQLSAQFAIARLQAANYGVSLATVNRAQAAASAQLRLQQRQQIAQFKSQIGLNSFADQLSALNAQFAAAKLQASQYGISLKDVERAQLDATAALKKQQEAQIDALALGAIDPFKQLRDPLQSFLTSLKFADLSPLQQLEAARKDFERIANLARAGSTTAIQQLQGAGELFVRLSEQAGASPGRAAANLEVASVIEGVVRDIDRAQKQAQQGFETEIRRSTDRQIDKLNELIATTREQLNEIKKLRR